MNDDNELFCGMVYDLWPLLDAIFTGRSFRADYDTSFVGEWKIYYSLLF